MKFTRILALGSLVLLVAPPSPTMARLRIPPVTYGIQDLGVLGANSKGNSFARFINNNSQIAGESDRFGSFASIFLWDSGVLQDLGRTGYGHTVMAFNDRGDVAGYGYSSFTADPAYYWSSSTGVVPISVSPTFALSVTGMNNSGQVVGKAYGSTWVGQHAYVWSVATGFVDLGSLGGDSEAKAINDAGTVVGTSSLGGYGEQAFKILAGGPIQALASQPAVAQSQAVAVSGDDWVAGTAWVPPLFGSRAVLWAPDGTMVDLGGNNSNSVAMNASHQVAGNATDASFVFSAFFWDGATLTTFPGFESLGSSAIGINRDGIVIGTSRSNIGPDHGFVWIPGVPVPFDLGAGTIPSSINDGGQVVGQYVSPAGEAHGFRWSQASPFMLDLGVLPGRSSMAMALNDSGQVLGGSSKAGGAWGAFVSTPAGLIQDVGSLGGYQLLASSLNASGEAVGIGDLPGGLMRPWYWSSSRNLNVIPLPANASYVPSTFRINASGLVAGGYQDSTGIHHPFLWNWGGSIRELPTLGGEFSGIYGMNDNGLLVGSAMTPGYIQHACSWTEAGGIVVLNLPVGATGYALAVNANDQIIGNYQLAGSNHAFLSTNGVVRDLGHLGGGHSLASGVNSSGQVVGQSVTAAFEQHAFLWDPVTSVMEDLGNPAWRSTSALAINDVGWVVGTGATVDYPQHSFVWSRQDGMRDLGTLVTSRADALTINAAGQIVGSSYTVLGEQRAVRWNPDHLLPVPVLATLPPFFEAGHNVVIDGHASFSADAAPLAFEWSEGGSVLSTADIFNQPLGQGDHTLTLRVTNAQGDVGMRTIVVHVKDTQSPILLGLPLDVNRVLLPGVPAIVSIAWPTAQDDADGVVAVLGYSTPQVFPNGTASGGSFLFPDGDTQIEFRATDIAGHTTSAPMVVHITRAPYPSFLDSVSDVSANANPATLVASVPITFPHAQDGLGIALTVVAHTTSGTAAIDGATNTGTYDFPVGNTVVTFTVVDGGGNSVSATMTVSVANPANTTPTNPVVSLGGGSTVPGGLTLTFTGVTGAGNTTAVSSPTGPALPAGFQLGTPPLFWDISTTAGFTPPVVISINMDGMGFTDPPTVRLMHYNSGTSAWDDITDSNDGHIVIGHTDTFSPFALMQVGNLATACAALEARVKAAGLPKGATIECLAILEVAEQAFARGNELAGSLALRAFELAVRAQAGKKIPQTLATSLLAAADSIIHAASVLDDDRKNHPPRGR